jgi:hypothetical protein
MLLYGDRFNAQGVRVADLAENILQKGEYWKKFCKKFEKSLDFVRYYVKI